jgi:hypothetical protein
MRTRRSTSIAALWISRDASAAESLRLAIGANNVFMSIRIPSAPLNTTGNFAYSRSGAVQRGGRFVYGRLTASPRCSIAACFAGDRSPAKQAGLFSLPSINQGQEAEP